MNTRIPTPSSHNPSTHPSVPQIRSRITVVCAECKRLKLKCDRRNPCGSCTKRDTVSRCVYSPAAAEKVDLHSLNNRLIQVEATLSLLTSGQTPPVFQSSYPYSQVQSNGASNVAVPHPLDGGPSAQPPTGPQHHHRHHHHNSAPPCASDPLISLTPRDLSSIWLDDLDRAQSPLLNVKLPYNLTKDADSIKLETSIGELAYGEPSQRPSPLLQNMHFGLPPLGFYFAPGSSVRFPDVQPVSQTSASTSYMAPHPHSLASAAGKPTVTPSLVALLPSLARAKQLLGNAVNILRQRPIPLPACLLSSLPDGGGGAGNGRTDAKANRKGKAKDCTPLLATHWDALEFRTLCLIGSRGLSYGTAAKTGDRKEREKVGARAREIFFGSSTSSNMPAVESLPSQRPGSQIPKRSAGDENGASERVAGERGESLPFFAIVCFLLALGAVGSKAGDMEPQLMASDQNPVLDEKESPEFLYALGQQSLGVWENSSTAVLAPDADDKEASKADEDEKLDYLVASLLGVGYQIFQSHANPKGKDSEKRRINILNKMFTTVGKMVNTARSMGLERDRKSPVRCKNEELSAGKSGVKDSWNGKDGKKRTKTGERRRRKEELRRLIWWDIVFYELFISDTLGYSSLLSDSLCAVNPSWPHLPADELESDLEEDQQDLLNGREEQYHEMLERYHAARCRLANIAQMIKRKLVHPDCCCGYTLDQACVLEWEVSRFLEDLPSPLRFDLMEETEGDAMARYQDLHNLCRDEAQRSTLRWQSCELAIMAQRLIIMIYLPFLRTSASASANPTPNVATLSHDADSTAQNSDAPWNPALQPIFNAAQCIIQASKTVLLASTFTWSSGRRLAPLFDLYPVEKALLDATIICTHAGTFHGTLFTCRQAADDASLGMGLLLGLDLDLEFQVLLDRVKKRFYVSVHPPESLSIHGTKRKHGLMGAESSGRDFGALRYPSYPNAAERPMTTQPPAQQGIHNDISSDLVGGRASSVESACSGRDPETGQKGKKHAKKNHPYPPVGIRVRQRKEALPPFIRQKVDSPSSIPSPGRESGMQTPQQENDMQQSLVPSPAGEGPQQQLTPLSDFGPPLQAQMGPSPPVMASLLDESSYRPSSCSLNQDPHLHSQSQHEPRQSYPTPYSSAYEHGSRLASQEPQVNASRVDHFEGSGDSDTQTIFNSIPHASGAVESGPYGTSGHVPPSDTSPYIPNGSVNPSITPFGQATRSMVSHRPSPAYAQEMNANTNGHSYYHIPPDPSFSTIYDRSEDASTYADIGLNTTNGASATIIHGARNSNTVDVGGLTGAVSNPPPYDVKLERLVQPPMHNHALHHQPYSVGQRHVHSQNQHPMSLDQQTPAWASQPAITADCSQRFWASSVGGFKYGH